MEPAACKVRDELARNEATGLAANTVQPLNDPSAGEQRFAAYRCGCHAPLADAPTLVRDPAPRSSQEAQTFPVRGD